MTDLNEAAPADSDLVEWLKNYIGKQQNVRGCRHAADRIAALSAENARWKANSIANHEAFAAMRNDLNELFPIQSAEADLLEGPEMSVACAAIVQAAEAQVAALTKQLDEAAKVIEGLADMEREYETEYAGRTYECCRGCDAQLSEDEPHNDDCPFIALDAARAWQASHGEGE